MSENFEVNPEADLGTEEYEKKVSIEREGILVDTLVAKIGQCSKEQCNRLVRLLEAALMFSVRRNSLKQLELDAKDRSRQSPGSKEYDQKVTEQTQREFESERVRLYELIEASQEFLPAGVDSDFFSSLSYQNRQRIEGTLKSRQFEVGV